MKKRFPFHPQLDAMDCGPAALRMVCTHHGRELSQSWLRELCHIGKGGVSLLGISEAAEKVGLRSLAVRLSYVRLRDEAPLPCIAHWQADHFVVVHEFTRNKVRVADPAYGLVDYSPEEFIRASSPPGTPISADAPGIYLLLETTPAFHEQSASGRKDAEPGRRGLPFFFTYLRPYKKLLVQVAVGMLVGLGLELILPFLSQAVVDYGIGNLDLHFIYVLLAAQLMLSLSQTAADMIRSWLLLHIGSRVSIAMIADFLSKLRRLPLPFFDSRTAGDIMQRIGDHRRVKGFLMSSSLEVIFSLMTFVVFAAVLALCSWQILATFAIFSAVAVGWLLIFLKQRRMLDYKRFTLEAKERDTLMEIVSGMAEVKIQGLQRDKRWDWEQVAMRTCQLEARSLTLRQTQRLGVHVVSNIRNILISFLAARAVLQGQMTFGMMLATQYIVGQLNSPISRMIEFIYGAQDARLSLDRMQEIYEHKDEDEGETHTPETAFHESRTLTISGLSFRYPGAGRADVLKDISLVIPPGKVTAIVGASGSGKTTLLKLLLGLYRPSTGEIRVDSVPLSTLDGHAWRARCGVVMQDGFIFSGTFARNVVPGSQPIDSIRMRAAIQLASMDEFVRGQPNGIETVVGAEGQSARPAARMICSTSR